MRKSSRSDDNGDMGKERRGWKKWERVFWLGLVISCWGCSTLVKPLPAFNLQEAGWSVRQGQAIWQPEEKAPELVGDILLATHPNGRAFVQFSKGLPIVNAQLEGGKWQVSFPPENREYRGAGKPPKRIVWLHLPDLFQGGNPPGGWSLVTQREKELEVAQEQRGERLRVVLE